MQDDLSPYRLTDDALSQPVDLNTAQPIQNFAVGGIANPGQTVFLRPSDKAYLNQRQQMLEDYERQRQAYNDALTKYQTEVYNPYQAQVKAYNDAAAKYNEEVYKPYETQYAAYEKAVNDWNAGSRETDYAGPSEPVVASKFEMTAPKTPEAFSMTAPTLPFEEKEVQEYQQAAAQRAKTDAANRALAIDVVSNPDRFNFGSMSVANRFMAHGGEVEHFAEGGEVVQESEEPDSEGYYQQLLAQYAGYGAPAQEPVQNFALGGMVTKVLKEAGKMVNQAIPPTAPQREEVTPAPDLLPRRDIPVVMPVTPAPFNRMPVSTPRPVAIPRPPQYPTAGGRDFVGPVYPPTNQGQPPRIVAPNAGNPPLLRGIAALPRGDAAPWMPTVPQPGFDGRGPWMPTVPQPAPRPSPRPQSAVNANLTPGVLGGQQNLGVMVDRLGNRIASPMQGPAIRAFAEGGPVQPAAPTTVREVFQTKFGPRVAPPPAEPPPPPNLSTIRGRFQAQFGPMLAPPPAEPEPQPTSKVLSFFSRLRQPQAETSKKPSLLTPVPLPPGRAYWPDYGQPVKYFAKGGSAGLDAMSALIDASEPQTEDEATYDYMTQSQRMLEDLGPRTSPRQAVGMSRVMVPSGGGAAAPKEMELAAGPLTTGQDFAIKESKAKEGKGKGGKSAKEQLQALAKQYKLKLRAAENESRGLMRSTLGAPTLEQPTLTSDTLMVRRFEKGGEVTSSPEEQPVTEESSASRALKSIVSPVMEGLRGYAGLEPSASGSDAYRTGQALGNMPGVGVPGALAGIFIGKGAKGWNAASNALAQKMTKQGASPEEVWQATGNFKAPDGMWRQEISDAGATIRESVLQGRAERVLSHPELFANYPELGKLSTIVNPRSINSALVGGADPGAVITVGGALGKNAGAKGMLHELQHAIQFKENFGQGGSKALAFTDPQAFEILKTVRARMAQPMSAEKFAKEGWQSDVVTPEIAQNYQKYLNHHKKNLTRMDKAAQEAAAEEYYMRLLGEAESRAVELRKDMPWDKRLQVVPSQSYRMNDNRDVIPLDKLIVKRAEGSPKEGEVSDAELEAASRPAFVTPKSGKGRKRGPISEALNTGSAYVAAAKGASELPYDLVGAPVDIATMALRPLGYNVDKPVMGSDWIKEKMTRAGVRQAPPEDPTAKGFFTAGEALANLVNPAGVVRGGVNAARRAGQAASDVAKDFQEYNRQLAVPGASYAARPEGTQLLVRRGDNSDWVGSLINDGVSNVQQALPRPQLGTERQSMMENFWENKATNYFSKQFGTESDPVYRGIREQAIKSPSLTSGFPNYILDQLPVGKTRVNQETGQTRFFPKYPEAWDEMRKRYDAYTNITGAVPELNPQRVMDPQFTYSYSREGQARLDALKDKEIDRMIAQGTPVSQANPRLDFLTRSVKDPDTVIGGYYTKPILTDFETTTGTRVGDPNFQGVPSALPTLPQNLRTAMEKGETIYNTPGPEASIRNLFDVRAINEYLAGLPDRELKNIRFEDAVKGGAKVSAERFARDTLVADIKAGRRVPDKFFSEGVSAPLMQFKEGPYAGYAWKRIEKAEATVPEGAYVGHSVGGYAKGGAYGPEKHKLFNDGTMQVYTLRDNRNRPVNTIEVRVDPMASGPIVTQIKGNGRATGNTAPVAYDNLVLDFLQNTLKPMRITESETYLTPLLKSYRDQLNAARP